MNPEPPRIRPPVEEAAMGLGNYLTTGPGIGGRLRAEVEDFQVIELGPGPPAGDGPFTAARIRLTNWETNRFVNEASRRVGIRPGLVGFGGMKDKRAVTEQWFSFKAKADRLTALDELQDVEILDEPYRARDKYYPGAHQGNRFILRVREHNGDLEAAKAAVDAIRVARGVPNYFGPQRFGSHVRPVTPLMGKAIVAGDLEEAVRLYCGHPYPDEPEETRAARQLFEETRDPLAALDIYPRRLDFERKILERLVNRPGDWRNALLALPKNLVRLFIHSWQSLLFNHIVSDRLEAGLGLHEAHVGDRVMAFGEDGTATVPVTPWNQARVQKEIDAGRASPTAPLMGMGGELATGPMGDLEQAVMDRFEIDPHAFRCRELPAFASEGRRRTVIQPVHDLELSIVEGDPVVSFGLEKGSYATVVMREIMKSSSASM